MSTQKLASFASKHFEPCNGRDLEFKHVKQACKKQMEIDYKKRVSNNNHVPLLQTELHAEGTSSEEPLENIKSQASNQGKICSRYVINFCNEVYTYLCYSHFITGEPSSLHRKLMTRQQEHKQ